LALSPLRFPVSVSGFRLRSPGIVWGTRRGTRNPIGYPMGGELVVNAELFDNERGPRQRSEDRFDGRPMLRIAHVGASFVTSVDFFATSVGFFATRIVSQKASDPYDRTVVTHDEAPGGARALLQFSQGRLRLIAAQERLAL